MTQERQKAEGFIPMLFCTRNALGFVGKSGTILANYFLFIDKS
jgi:hypothetical protein